MSIRLFTKFENIFQISTKTIHLIFNTNIKVRKRFSITSKPFSSELSGSSYENISSEPIIDEDEPDKIFKYFLNKDNVYILNTKVADEVINHLPNYDFKLFEINPGCGVLTKTLLEKRKEPVRVFESKKEYIPFLKQLQQEYGPEKLHVHFINFYNLPRLLFQDKMHGSNYREKLFYGLEINNWENDPQLVMLGVFPPSRELAFLQYMLRCLCNRCELFHYGRIEFLFFMSHKCYSIISSSTGDYNDRNITAAFQLLINIQLLSVVNISNVSKLPPPKYSRMKTKGWLKYDMENLYLVRIVPKKEVQFKLLPGTNIPELLSFIYLCYRHKRFSIVYTLNKLIPDCGHRLIKIDFTTTQTFMELSPLNYVALFNEVASWPEYQNSKLHGIIMETSFSKLNDLRGS